MDFKGISMSQTGFIFQLFAALLLFSVFRKLKLLGESKENSLRISETSFLAMLKDGKIKKIKIKPALEPNSVLYSAYDAVGTLIGSVLTTKESTFTKEVTATTEKLSTSQKDSEVEIEHPNEKKEIMPLSAFVILLLGLVSLLYVLRKGSPLGAAFSQKQSTKREVRYKYLLGRP